LDFHLGELLNRTAAGVLVVVALGELVICGVTLDQ
jgi:hypothetical protein